MILQTVEAQDGIGVEYFHLTTFLTTVRSDHSTFLDARLYTFFYRQIQFAALKKSNIRGNLPFKKINIKTTSSYQ